MAQSAFKVNSQNHLKRGEPCPQLVLRLHLYILINQVVVVNLTSEIKIGEVSPTDLFNPIIVSSRFQKKLHYGSPVVAGLEAMADDVLHIIANHLEKALSLLFFFEETHPFENHPKFFVLNNKARLGSPCRGEPSSKSLHICCFH